MDKLYKPLFAQAVKQRMAHSLPEFARVKVAREAPTSELFSGAMLYCSEVHSRAVMWLYWELGPGVERRFDVRLGWSPARHVLPAHGEHDARIYSLQGPTSEFPACSIPLQQALGEVGIAGYAIRTPWDQLYDLKPSTPAREQKRVTQKAFAEAQALSPGQRLVAIEEVLERVFASLQVVLPKFVLALKASDD